MESFIGRVRYGQQTRVAGVEYDIMAAFDPDAHDALRSAKKNMKSKEMKDAEDGENKDTPDEPLEVDWDGLDDRTVRLTKDSSNITQSYLNKDASKLYFLKRHASGSELWVREFREDNTKLLRKLDRTATFEFTPDEETLFVLSGGKLSHASVDSLANPKSIGFNAAMTLRSAAERDYMFQHAWRQIQDKFYNPDFHGIDWEAMKERHHCRQSLITAITNLMAEMTGN